MTGAWTRLTGLLFASGTGTVLWSNWQHRRGHLVAATRVTYLTGLLATTALALSGLAATGTPRILFFMTALLTAAATALTFIRASHR